MRRHRPAHRGQAPRTPGPRHPLRVRHRPPLRHRPGRHPLRRGRRLPPAGDPGLGHRARRPDPGRAARLGRVQRRHGADRPRRDRGGRGPRRPAGPGQGRGRRPGHRGDQRPRHRHPRQRHGGGGVLRHRLRPGVGGAGVRHQAGLRPHPRRHRRPGGHRPASRAAARQRAPAPAHPHRHAGTDPAAGRGRPREFTGSLGISLTLGFGGFNTCLLLAADEPRTAVGGAA